MRLFTRSNRTEPKTKPTLRERRAAPRKPTLRERRAAARTAKAEAKLLETEQKIHQLAEEAREEFKSA
ncbi:MAG: hypothetical protein ABIS86_14650 [Streptosporangiaceae bacterium]